MADGLLGWPGFGPGGSQQWKAQRLYTGDIWYAPRSGFYLITGCGGGAGGPGGSGATLINCPLYIPEGAGGSVVIGTGGSPGNNGTDTKLGGNQLILGGGIASGATGSISGQLITLQGRTINSIGTGYVTTNSNYRGGHSAPNSANLTGDILNDFLMDNFKISQGGVMDPGSGSGTFGTSGADYGAGGMNGFLSSGSGAGGFLAIAWVGSL